MHPGLLRKIALLRHRVIIRPEHQLAEQLPHQLRHAGVPPRNDPQNLPPEVRQRMEQLRDSLNAEGEEVQLRTVATAVRVRPFMRSRAIFYNGAGPAPLSLGPDLPFEEAIAEYRTYGGEKAFALAVAEDGRRAWGYGFGFRTTQLATERALLGCRRGVERRGLQATCEVYAVGDSIPSR